MPVNVRRFYTSVLFTLLGAAAAGGQTVQPSPAPVQPVASPQIVAAKPAPTSAEVMRERISKAKAFIAVRNYNAAIYELENIRRETSDSSVNAVTNVLLMNSYLEQGDYKRAQEFLNELYSQQKTTKPGAAAFYAAVSGQVVKSSRNQIDRYRALGLTVSDRNLPLEALNDIEKMREMLEIVVTQAKEMSADKTKTAAAMAMLEEATNSRSALARDDYDARRWRDAVADSREELANSRSVITNAVDGTVTQTSVPQTSVRPNTVAMNTQPIQQQAPVQTQTIFRPVMDSKPGTLANTQIDANSQAGVQQPDISPVMKPVTDTPRPNRVVPDAPRPNVAATPNIAPPPKAAVEGSPLEVGSLIAYATKQPAPVYPAAARTIRATGVVKVEVTVDESGDVAAVGKTSGPPLLQNSAKDAIRKWKFKPFTRDGQPVKATGFVNFNFNL
ncbi:MAG: TonB family protein [Pyrinomonadaceae bacterium]